MKKGLLFIFVLILLGMMGFVAAQSTNPWSADANGKEKNTFIPSDSVYVESYTVCFGTNNISLYLVNGIAVSGEDLNDVRGQTQNIKTTSQGFVLLTKVASNLTSGDYTLVLDCNNNGVYDTGEYSDVFSVEVVGEGIAGGEGIDSTFSYDYNIGNNEVEMLKLNLNAVGEDVKIQSLELQANGTGNDLVDVDKIKVYFGGEVLKEGKFAADNGKAVIALDNFSISNNENATIFIAYVIKNFVEGSTYSFSLVSINAIGSTSNQKVLFSGLPISSSTLTIGKTKTCSGSVNIDLSKDNVNTEDTVQVSVSGITNCSSPTSVRLVTCENNISLCQLVNNTCSFVAPSIAGSYAVFACIDKNEDGLYNNEGESESVTLTVKIKETPINNATTTITNITSPITGNVVEGNETSSTGINFNLTTILAIGMVIIFVILIIILIMLFKLAAKK